VSVGSLCLGILSGLIAGLVFKSVAFRDAWLLEFSLYILVMYVPFFVAEVLHLSGIVTILFCGISARRYAEPNLSREVSRLADGFFHVFAHLAETAIFLELGLSVFGLQSHGNFYPKFISWAMLACLLGRAANIYPIAMLYNQWLDGKFWNKVRFNRSLTTTMETSLSRTEYNREERHSDHHQDLKIETNTCHMLWYSGLRGAVAYACAKTFPDANDHQAPFCITTMIIVLTTTFLFGGTTEIALDVLEIDVNVDEDEYLKQIGGGKKAGIIRTFEDRYVFPCVLRDYGRSSSDDGKRRRRREDVLHDVDDGLGDDLYLHADDDGENGDAASSLHARQRGGDIELRSSSTGNEFRGRKKKKTALMDADDDEGSVCLADDDGNTIEYIRQSSGGLSAVC
jgi:sodium/hydrogen exchanger 8